MGSFTTAELHALGTRKKKTKALLQQGRLTKLVCGLYTDDHSPDSVVWAITGHYESIVLNGKSVAQIHLRPPPIFPIRAEGVGSVQTETFPARHSRLPTCASVNDLPVIEAFWVAQASKGYAYRILETHYVGRDGHRRLDHGLNRMRKVPAWLRETIVIAPIGAYNELERELARLLTKHGYRFRVSRYIGPYCFDILLDQWKMATEVDSEKYHADVDSFITDRWKANSGTLHGWIVPWFTDSCTNWNLDSVLDEVK